MDEYLTKPFDRKQLRETIERTVAGFDVGAARRRQWTRHPAALHGSMRPWIGSG